MKIIFPAVFESVWKRKETKIFLLFAFYPLLYFIGPFFGSSNFMKIIVEPGHKLGYLSFLGMMFMSIDSFVLPTLALYFLTLSVFKKEIDERVMFIYKDLDRKKVFFSKYFSILIVVFTFFVLLILVTLGVYYGRVARMDIGLDTFFDNSWEETLYSLSVIFSLLLKIIFSLTLASCFGLFLKYGGTMLLALLSSILFLITGVIGGPFGMLFPNGYTGLLENGTTGTVFSFLCPLLLTILYSIILTKIASKKFINTEF